MRTLSIPLLRMRTRTSKPADAFAVGDRIIFKGESGTVIGRAYQDSRKSVMLQINLDRGGGERWIYPSGEQLEVGDPLPLLRRLARRLRRL